MLGDPRLALAWLVNDLCQREQLPLPPDGLALLRQWMAAEPAA